VSTESQTFKPPASGFFVARKRASGINKGVGHASYANGGKGAEMSEGTGTQGTEGSNTTPATEGTGFKPIETQADFDKMFNKLFAEKIGKERDKFSDYDELKAKAAKLDAQEEANKTELQKATDRAAAAEAKAKAMEDAVKVEALRTKIAKDNGVSPDLLRGQTEEELEQHAKALAEALGSPQPPVVQSDTGQPAKVKSTAAADFAEYAKSQLS
jgi:hypothetical protein